MEIQKEISILHRKAFIYLREDKRLQAAEILEELCIEMEAQFGNAEMAQSTKSVLDETLKHYKDASIDLRSTIATRQVMRGQIALDVEIAKRQGYVKQLGTAFIYPTYKGWTAASRHITEFEIKESLLKDIINNEENEYNIVLEKENELMRLEQERINEEADRAAMEQKMREAQIEYQRKKEEILQRNKTFDDLFPNKVFHTKSMQAKLIGKKLRKTKVEMAIVLKQYSDGSTKEEMINNLEEAQKERYNALQSHADDLLCAAYKLGVYNTIKALKKSEDRIFIEVLRDNMGNHMDIDDLL